MKNISFLRHSCQFLAAVFLFLLSSCDDNGDDPAPSDQDLTIETLSTSSFSYDAANSSTSATGIDISQVSLTLSRVNESATFNFTLSGDIENVVTGGILEVTDTGNIQLNSLSVSSDSNLSVAPGSSTSFQNGVLTLDMETSNANARSSGLGTFTLVFTTN